MARRKSNVHYSASSNRYHSYSNAVIRPVSRPIRRVLDMGRTNVHSSRSFNNYDPLDVSRFTKRSVRQLEHNLLKTVLPKHEYKKVHNCGHEYRKLLSWRAAQGGGR